MDQRIIEFDLLQMYFGEPYIISDKIKIHQPTIGEIVEFGEKKMYQSISPFVSNTTTYRLQLWDLGIDWNEISDYDLFIMLIQTAKQEETKLIFGDLDFTLFKPCMDQETNKVVLYDIENDIVIDELIYIQMSEYIRAMFNQYPKVEKAKNKFTKEALIDEDRINLAIAQQKEKDTNKSILLSLISSMLNHAGFKYKKNELKEVGIVEFMDSVQRLQLYESTRALMSGMYSGFLDTSKMNLKKELNWLRDLNDKK